MKLMKGCVSLSLNFLNQHPTSDAVVFGGTEDNGTLLYRNSPTFYFSDYGDGGFVAIDPETPNIIIGQLSRSL